MGKFLVNKGYIHTIKIDPHVFARENTAMYTCLSLKHLLKFTAQKDPQVVGFMD